MLNNLTHTQSLNPSKGYEIQQAQLTKSVGESLLVENKDLGSSGMPGNQQPSKERAEGYKYPTSKNQLLLYQYGPVRPAPQTSQIGLFKKLAVTPWTGKTGPLDRSDRSGPKKPKPRFRCSTWSTKLTLDHPSSTKLVLRGFLSGFSLG